LSKLPYLAYAGLASGLRNIPESAAYIIAGNIAEAMRHKMKTHREMIKRNMRRATGYSDEKQLDDLVKKAFHSYGIYWADSALVCKYDANQLEKRMSAVNYGEVFKALDSKRGVIMALSHLGSWEAGGAWLANRGYPMMTIAEELKPKELFDWFVAERRKIGIEVQTANMTGVAKLISYLKSGGLVGLICDRDLGGSGIKVNFFEENTTLPAGPATLALRTGAMLVTAAVYQEGRGKYLGVVGNEIKYDNNADSRKEIARVTQEIANALEKHIKYRPWQWHLMQPNWPSDYEFLARL
jgi:lauroyl/myristoyl acyltransferase